MFAHTGLITVSRLPSFRLSHEAPLNEAISLPTKLGQTDDKRPDRQKSQKAPKQLNISISLTHSILLERKKNTCVVVKEVNLTTFKSLPS